MAAVRNYLTKNSSSQTLSCTLQDPLTFSFALIHFVNLSMTFLFNVGFLSFLQETRFDVLYSWGQRFFTSILSATPLIHRSARE